MSKDKIINIAFRTSGAIFAGYSADHAFRSLVKSDSLNIYDSDIPHSKRTLPIAIGSGIGFAVPYIGIIYWATYYSTNGLIKYTVSTIEDIIKAKKEHGTKNVIYTDKES